MDKNSVSNSPYGKNIFKAIWKLLIRFQEVILILSSILIVIGISTVVIFRYIFNFDLFGMEEIILIGALWLYFIGSSYGAYDRSHITADFVSAYTKNPRVRLFLKALNSLITLLICLLYAYWSIDFFEWTLNSGAKTTALQIPTIISQSAITVGFFMMSFYFIVYFVRDIKNFFTEPKQ